LFNDPQTLSLGWKRLLCGEYSFSNPLFVHISMCLSRFCKWCRKYELIFWVYVSSSLKDNELILKTFKINQDEFFFFLLWKLHLPFMERNKNQGVLFFPLMARVLTLHMPNNIKLLD